MTNAKITIEADGFKYEKELTRTRAIAIAFQFEKEAAGTPESAEPPKSRGGVGLSEKQAPKPAPAKPAAENPEPPKRRWRQPGTKLQTDSNGKKVLVCPPADATRNGDDWDDEDDDE